MKPVLGMPSLCRPKLSVQSSQIFQPWLNNVFVHHNVHQPCTSTTISINHVNVHYNQRCYRYKVNNKIITLLYNKKESAPTKYVPTTECIDNGNVRRVKSGMYCKLSKKKCLRKTRGRNIKQSSSG